MYLLSEIMALLFSLMMTGLIWFVQMVHYPLFKAIPPEHFRQYETRHTSKTGLLVAPLMLIEMGFGFLFWWMHTKDFWNHFSLLMLLIVWFSTFFIQVPLHSKLTKKHDDATINKLIQTNWIRTIC